MLIASKYEEIYVPELVDFVFISDNTYSQQEIIEMERSILITLEFNISYPTSYRFLERFAKVAKVGQNVFYMAQYFLELTLLECRMLVYYPSLLAAAALFLAIRMFYRDMGVWTFQMQQCTQYNAS